MEQERYPRKRQSHWDKLHLKTVSTHLTVEEYERLRAACRYRGKPPYELVRAYLLEYTARVFEHMELERWSGGGYSRFGRHP